MQPLIKQARFKTKLEKIFLVKLLDYLWEIKKHGEKKHGDGAPRSCGFIYQ